MYFKRLEIFGFKSFADKTVLNFEKGITAIVGPNGCGKSNVFDSIRWVLGEQSVKELRGASMEDVIFNGTDKKPSLGFAEVSVTFSNESRMLAIEYDEVTVTRRLFRSGESEYLLNKTVVRLKDIQELLMGTGIGAEAYSLVQQGKVDLVVSAKPEDRRMILDEASGITKYKAKKREALNKLKDTDNNLLRVNDIVVEVKRQITSIERQATKARKYKEEFERLKVLELALARFQLNEYTQKRDEILRQIEEFRTKESEFSKEVESLNTRLTEENDYLDEIEHKINDVRADEIKLDGQIDLHTRQVSFNLERIEGIFQSEKKNKEQKEQLIERCRIQQIKIEDIKKIISGLEESIAASGGLLAEKQNELSLIERTIQESKSKIQEAEEKNLNLTTQQISVRNSLTDVIKEVQGALARQRRLEIENEKVLGERTEIDQKLQNVEYQLRTVHGAVSDLYTRRQQEEEKVNQSRNIIADLMARLDNLEKKRLFLRSQKEFTEKLNAQYQDIPDPIVEGRFFSQVPPLEHHTGIIGKVKEVKQITDPQDPIKARVGTDQNLYEIICETKFIELDIEQLSSRINEISEEIILLTWQKEEAEAHLKINLESLKQVELEVLAKEKSLSILESQKTDVLVEANKIAGELQIVDSEMLEVQESLFTVKKREEELNFQLDSVNQELVWCQNEIRGKQDYITAKAGEKETVNVALAQMKAEFEANQQQLKSQLDNQQMFNESLDSWLDEIKKIDDELATFASKVDGYYTENDELEAKIGEIKSEKNSLTNILADYENQKADLSQRLNSMRAQVESIGDQLEEARQQAHIKEMEVQQVQFSEQALKDRLFQTYKINIDEINATPAIEQQPAVAEIIPVEGDAQVSSDGTTIPLEASVPAVQPQPVAQPVFEVDIDFSNPEEIMAELQKLRKKCEAFGSVNLVAIEEFEELKGRFEFLTQQQADLLEAKSQLMNTITKINRSTRQMFMDTFTKVSEEFRIYFRMLFGGGEANLILLDPENVLESGIEIVARPPGKKLQSISLMSGGEKTLTAIALIFGVFKVNPSPFCVLDEIDAALDESNVGRFSYLLKDFAKIAQFIVITHNKKTISSADVMYGITMPETGVSRVVSVKFKEDNKEAKQEVAAAV
jgi:chromosome segregation protein